MNSTQHPPSGLLDAALFYVDNGIAVLPLHTMTLTPDQESSEENPHYVTACDCSAEMKRLGKCAPAKHPISDLVPHGVLDATLEQATIRAWWREWPEANIGGALWPSGLVDIAPDSVEWWAEFTARGLPDTAHFASGGGDGHEHWLYDRGELPRVQINKTGLYDVMTAGYAVMPPSRHRSGNPYRWLEWQKPVDHPLWLPDMVARHQVEVISSAPVEAAETSDPPIVLTLEQVDVWEGNVEASDRSNALVEIARMLCDAGYQDVEGIASILAERDVTLGWNKYARRKDASTRYREIAARYGRPVPTAHLTGGSSGGGRPEGPSLKDGTGGRPPSQGWMLAHTIREERDRAPEEVDWIIEGWLGRGMMTELVAKVKLGKTTWGLQLLRACIAGDEAYCGQTIVRTARVLYVTEEGRATFHEALQRYGLWDLDDEMLVVYDFEILDYPLKDAVGEMIRVASEAHVDVVVIDTLTTVAGLDDEDNSGRVGAAMREFRRLANAGYAVFVLRHGRKAGGEVGDAGRGSSAISGAVDILLQIDPFKGDDDESNLRILRARGRMKATPTDPMTLEFEKETERYRLIGATVSKEERLASKIVGGLRDLGAIDFAHAVTSSALADAIHKRAQTVRDELKRLVEDGAVEDGSLPTVPGTNASPRRIFWLPPRATIHLVGDGNVTTEASAEGGRPGFESLKDDPSRDDPPDGTLDPPGPRAREGVVPEVPESGTTPPVEIVTKPQRTKTPEAVAKAAEKKAVLELARLEAADTAAPTLPYLVVPRDKTLADALELLSTVSVSLDTETTGLNAHRDKLRTIQLSDGATNVIIDTWEAGWSSRTLQSFLDRVEEVRMHTYLFDLAFLQSVGVTVDPEKVYDVRTAAMVLESKEDWTDYRLQGIAKRHLAQHVDKKEQKRGWEAQPLRHAKLAYAAEDARVTMAAGAALQDALQRDPDVDGLWNVLALERDAQAATWWLASAGAPADRQVMAEAVAEQEATLAAKLETLNAAAGVTSVNWRSPLQVLPILVAAGLDVESTAEGALMDTIAGTEAPVPLITALLAYRSAGACLGLLRKAQSSIQDDGRIYASFNPIGAQTGRTSCSDPNLQNLPHDTRAREAIRPPAGRVFVRADYSQLQLVIAAWIAQDQEMLRILNDPFGDVHQATADAVGCTRQQAKAVNFGFLFGAGAETFQREQRKNGVYLSDQQAWRYRETFMRTYRGIRSWHKGLTDWGQEETIFDPSGSGRRRSAVFSKNIKANTPVQMVEAHGFKRALQALYSSRHAVPLARLVMMVHDELIAETNEQDAEATKWWLIHNMLEPMQALLPGVQVRVDAKIVKSYADADK